MKIQLSAGAVIALAAVAGLVLFGRKWAGQGVQALSDAAASVGNAVNPLNHDNIFAGAVNAVGGAIVTDPDGIGKNADGSWSAGGALFDLTSDADELIKEMLKGSAEPVRYEPDPWSTGGGQWNNPSAYQTPGVTGDGGAAFGIYPRM